MTDVSVGFRPPCWCSIGRVPTWRLHTKLYTFRWNCLPNNTAMKTRTDLNLRDVFCLSIISHTLDSWLNLLNGYDFYFRCKPPIERFHVTSSLSKIQTWRATKVFILIRHKRRYIYICLQFYSSIAFSGRRIGVPGSVKFCETFCPISEVWGNAQA